MVFVETWGKTRPVNRIRARVWNRGQVWMTVYHLTVILSHTQTNNTLLQHYPNSRKVWADGRKMTEKLVTPVAFMSWRRIEDELLSLSIAATPLSISASTFHSFFSESLSLMFTFSLSLASVPYPALYVRESIQRYFYSPCFSVSCSFLFATQVDYDHCIAFVSGKKCKALLKWPMKKNKDFSPLHSFPPPCPNLSLIGSWQATQLSVLLLERQTIVIGGNRILFEILLKLDTASKRNIIKPTWKTDWKQTNEGINNQKIDWVRELLEVEQRKKETEKAV